MVDNPTTTDNPTSTDNPTTIDYPTATDETVTSKINYSIPPPSSVQFYVIGLFRELCF